MVNRSKIGKRNKAAAYRYEKKIADRLEEFTGREFCPTPRSGGLRWKSHDEVIGDLVTPEDFKFTVECKKYKEVDMERILFTRGPNTTDDIISFWKEACESAIRADRLPVLFYEQFRRKSVVCVPVTCVEDLTQDDEAVCYTDGHREVLSIYLPMSCYFAYFHIKLPKEIKQEHPEWEWIAASQFRNFLKVVDPERLFRG